MFGRSAPSAGSIICIINMSDLVHMKMHFCAMNTPHDI